MKRILLCYFLMALSVGSGAQVQHHFSFGKTDFLLDGAPFQVISGEMHPARIPREYWRNRIQMAKAMGCNSIAVYVFWNYHEKEAGVFDFSSGNHAVAEFIRLCKEERMWVLLRPGPYVCAEWDLGGLPPYLLKIPDIKLRCMDPRFMQAVKRYMARLAREIKPLLVSHGGNILMLQIENEYGSYGNDRRYLQQLKKLWIQNGIDVPFYTSDGASPSMLEAGSLEGAAIGLDSGSGDADFEEALKQNSQVPAFSSETYPGWLTHWGENWAKPDSNDLKKEMEYLLLHKKSFNLYVVHGGTNFGFTAGANAFAPNQYQPDITSYDYDAPIDEQGHPRAKFFLLRGLISKYRHEMPHALPDSIASMEIPALELRPMTDIWEHLPIPLHSAQPKPMEALGQQHGFILYRTTLIGHHSGKLTITEPHDFALVFLDGKLIDTVYRDGGNWTIDLPPTASGHPQLDILVEAMGHINFAQYMIDRKGITDRVTLNGMTLMDWESFLLPMEEPFIQALRPQKGSLKPGPKFFQASFNLEYAEDSYIDLSQFRKGLAWVNGHNLGRYWNKGPQQRLYCPAPWLKKGRNEIIVFDLLQEKPATVSGWKSGNN